MNRRSSILTFAIAVLAGVALVTPRRAAAQYDYALVTTASGSGNSLFGYVQYPRINNHGMVAYMGDTVDAATGLEGQGVFLWDGNVSATVLPIQPNWFVELSQHAVNDGGLVAFDFYTIDPDTGDYLTTGLAIGNPRHTRTVASSNGSFYYNAPVLNRSNRLLFGVQDSAQRQTSLVRGRPGSFDTLFTGGYSGPASVSAYSYNMSDDGTAIYWETDAGGNQGLYQDRHGVQTLLLNTPDTSDIVYYPAATPGLNNAGSIALSTFKYLPAFPPPTYLPVSDRIVRIDHGIQRTIAQVGLTFSAFDPRVSLNRAGLVAFGGITAQNPYTGIYVGNGHVVHKVVAPGDTLFGKTVLGTFDHSMNDAGQVTCIVEFDDFSEAIICATPHPRH